MATTGWFTDRNTITVYKEHEQPAVLEEKWKSLLKMYADMRVLCPNCRTLHTFSYYAKPPGHTFPKNLGVISKFYVSEG